VATHLKQSTFIDYESLSFPAGAGSLVGMMASTTAAAEAGGAPSAGVASAGATAEPATALALESSPNTADVMARLAAAARSAASTAPSASVEVAAAAVAAVRAR
jgi:hypothetical protein